jgi:hypothetical protein
MRPNEHDFYPLKMKISTEVKWLRLKIEYQWLIVFVHDPLIGTQHGPFQSHLLWRIYPVLCWHNFYNLQSSLNRQTIQIHKLWTKLNIKNLYQLQKLRDDLMIDLAT